jgi:hypothetical protein
MRNAVPQQILGLGRFELTMLKCLECFIYPVSECLSPDSNINRKTSRNWFSEGVVYSFSVEPVTHRLMEKCETLNRRNNRKLASFFRVGPTVALSRPLAVLSCLQ